MVIILSLYHHSLQHDSQCHCYIILANNYQYGLSGVNHTGATDAGNAIELVLARWGTSSRIKWMRRTVPSLLGAHL